MSIGFTEGEFTGLLALFVMLILFCPLPFVVTKLLHWIHDQRTPFHIVWPAYFSLLLFISVFLLLLPSANKSSNLEVLVLVDAIIIACLPWIIALRYRQIANDREEHFLFLYYFLFEAIQLIWVYTLLIKVMG